jgi:hypothetical protein
MAFTKSERTKRALRVALVHLGASYEFVERVAPGEIRLREEAIGTAFPPRGVGEAPVVLVGQKLGASGGDAPQLAHEHQVLSSRDAGIARHLADELARRVEDIATPYAD